MKFGELLLVCCSSFLTMWRNIQKKNTLEFYPCKGTWDRFHGTPFRLPLSKNNIIYVSFHAFSISSLVFSLEKWPAFYLTRPIVTVFPNTWSSSVGTTSFFSQASEFQVFQCTKWLPRDPKEGMPPSKVSTWLSRNGWHPRRLGINCCANGTELFFKISQGPGALIWAHWRAYDTFYHSGSEDCSPFKLAPRRLVLLLLVTDLTAHRGSWPQSVPSKSSVRILTSAKVLPKWIR